MTSPYVALVLAEHPFDEIGTLMLARVIRNRFLPVLTAGDERLDALDHQRLAEPVAIAGPGVDQ